MRSIERVIRKLVPLKKRTHDRTSAVIAEKQDAIDTPCKETVFNHDNTLYGRRTSSPNPQDNNSDDRVNLQENKPGYHSTSGASLHNDDSGKHSNLASSLRDNNSSNYFTPNPSPHNEGSGNHFIPNPSPHNGNPDDPSSSGQRLYNSDPSTSDPNLLYNNSGDHSTSGPCPNPGDHCTSAHDSHNNNSGEHSTFGPELHDNDPSDHRRTSHPTLQGTNPGDHSTSDPHPHPHSPSHNNNSGDRFTSDPTPHINKSGDHSTSDPTPHDNNSGDNFSPHKNLLNDNLGNHYASGTCGNPEDRDDMLSPDASQAENQVDDRIFDESLERDGNRNLAYNTRSKLRNLLRRSTHDTPDKEKDVIVAVMGPTGTGKSTFISNVTGYDEGIGHSLQSFTKDIRVVRKSLPGALNLVLVDTPGFNDTDRSDLDILKQISSWLESSYHNKNYLSGLLYFHRISDNRMAGTTLKNLEMFQKLCGSDNYSKVTLVTTMWEEVGTDAGAEREYELEQHYWRKLLAGGAKVRRLENDAESARAVLNDVLSNELNTRTIRIQRELAVLHKQLPDTGAGRQLRGNIEKLVERQQGLINRMVLEMALTKDPEVIASLREEFQQLRRMREEAIAQMGELNNNKMMRQLHSLWLFISDKTSYR